MVVHSRPDHRIHWRSLLPLLLLAGMALLVRMLLSPPVGVPSSDWDLLLLFATTVAAVVWQPYPVPVLVLLALAIGSATGVLSLEQTLAGYSNAVTWIIVAAFLFALSFVKTGLGRRIALLFIRWLGSSSLRLGYSLALTDLVLSPVTASNTARAGGIIFPVASSLARELGSEPGETARKVGSYLLFTCYQANVVTSALFLTSMAANGLSSELARKTVGVEISWALWLYASALPGALSFLLVPYLIYRTYPPQAKATPAAQRFAQQELEKLGPLKRREKVLLAVFVVLACTWATSGLHSVSTISAALAAISLLLLLGVLRLEEVAGEQPAWATFLWFGGFISMAGALTGSSLTSWFVSSMNRWFAGMDGLTTLILLVIVYVYLHYAFAGMTTQIIALYAAFVAIATAAGAPPLLAALVFCFFSSLYACLTHYGDGAAPIFYGSGYIDQKSWWRVGFYLSLAHLLIWLGVGFPWWAFLGIW